MKINTTKFIDIYETLTACWMKKDPVLGKAYTLEETPRVASIYFLCDAGENILYIGQSKNIGVRAAQHHSNAKMRSKIEDRWVKTYWVQPCVNDEFIRLRWEAVFILLCNPEVNAALALRKRKVGSGWSAIQFSNRKVHRYKKVKRPSDPKILRY